LDFKIISEFWHLLLIYPQNIKQFLSRKILYIYTGDFYFTGDLHFIKKGDNIMTALDSVAVDTISVTSRTPLKGGRTTFKNKEGNTIQLCHGGYSTLAKEFSPNGEPIKESAFFSKDNIVNVIPKKQTPLEKTFRKTFARAKAWLFDEQIKQKDPFANNVKYVNVN
jgi:hypothetical protein